MRNLTQFGSILVAVGCTLSFDTKTATLQLCDVPEHLRSIVDDALHDIVRFEDVATYEDGLAAFALADYFDNEISPLDRELRLRVLNTLGIMRGEQFVSQEIQSQKTTRSWHSSEEANTCSYFGEICTNRGMGHDPHKRGRPSNRKPEQFHPRKASGIGRENLITPAVEALVASIPKERLVSKPSVIDFAKIKDLSREQLVELMSMIQQEVAG